MKKQLRYKNKENTDIKWETESNRAASVSSTFGAP